MRESITLHGFGDNDRSGKIRWLARELGLEIEEQRVSLGAHRKAPYRELNPLAQIPTLIFRGQTYVESTAACQALAEAFDSPKLWVGRGEAQRSAYLYWLAAFTESLEGRLVEALLSRVGVLDSAFFGLHEKTLRFKLRVLADQLPESGFLCGPDLTVADVAAGYSLRLALQSGLVEREAIDPYFSRLVARPAAGDARFFDGLPS